MQSIHKIKTGCISAPYRASGFGPEKCFIKAVFPDLNYTLFFIVPHYFDFSK